MGYIPIFSVLLVSFRHICGIRAVYHAKDLNTMFKNRIILSLVTLFIMLLLGVASYYTSLVYQDYRQTTKEQRVSLFIDHIEKSLEKIDKERVESAVYLAVDTYKNLQALKSARDSVNHSLNNLENFVKQHPVFKAYVQSLKKVKIEVAEIRKKIDNVKNVEKLQLFSLYHTHVYANFSDILQTLFLTQKSEVAKNDLLLYGKYTALKENAVAQSTLTVYLLSRSRPMNSTEVLALEQFSKIDTLPDRQLFVDNNLAKQVNALLSVKAYSRILSREKEMIMHEARAGDYSVTVTGWLNGMKGKKDYFSTVLSLLSANIHTIEKHEIREKLLIVGSLLLLLVLLLFLLFKLLKIYYTSIQNRHLSPETLKDIGLVFDSHQQAKIQRLIKEGKVDNIYKFLIQAIKDGNQTKDLFLASMSHEIRTPLNGILGFTQLLKESDDPQEQIEFISVIEKSSVNLLSIEPLADSTNHK